jgi:hypothetical protein
MQFKRAIITSAVIHAIVLGFLSAGLSFSWMKPKKNLAAIEARLTFKGKARDKELLPRKKSRPVAQNVIPPKALEKAPEAKAATAPELPKVGKEVALPVDKPVVKETKIAKAKKDYASELKKLSQSFSEDLSNVKPEHEPEEFSEEDSNYFDQIYGLIKESFIVPPHVNGPAGHKLQAVIRLFLLNDGSLSKLDLEHSSGDEHFDRAVIDGAKRVNNFGKVPILLQNALSERGVVVELCPFKCSE